LQQLSACFVLPVEDSIDGIYDTLKHQAIIHKSGGGTGFSFSRLRPKNDIVKSTMGVSSGPVSFMAIYDASTDKIKQGGTRRGANMGILRVDHPDIEEFITCKNDNNQINNFNISVAVTDAFMEAVENDTDFDLANPRNGEVAKTVRARDLFSKIVEGAWLNGEPGVVFIDRINADNPTPQFPIESTNPCSEAHLPPYDSCNLGSINLERFFVPGSEPGEGSVDWDSLSETVHTTIRFLDNVIEMNDYPLPQIDEMSRGNRRIGLGVMGFADLLIRLGITYDSEEGLAFAERIMKFIDDEAWEASRSLAEERGLMPHYEGSRHEARGDKVRNATVTTIAPTGTISIIAGCSGGIEPLFAVAFMRRQADMELPDVNPEFVKIAKARGFYSEELMKKVAEHGGVRNVPEIPEDVRSVWVTSHDISPEWHVRMQAAFQKYTSMGISKTINLPNEATLKDVEDAYRFAYSLGCKAMAVYRDGSRDAQVLSTGKTKTQAPPTLPVAPGPEAEVVKHVSLAEARNGRPRTLSGVTKKLQTGHGPMYVTMNDDEFGPRECFVILGKPGGTAAAFSDALGRMISLAMTHGATPAEIVHQLRGIQDGHPAGVGPSAVLSVPDGVARSMADHYLIEDDHREKENLPIIGACPDCGGGLTRQEGCVVCHSCGYSKCS
jgi:ribonucleoside-diphosphate reductase alpha chain